MKLIANYQGYSNTAESTFQVTLTDQCASSVLSIDASILSSLNINYNIGEGSQSIQLLNSLVTASPPPMKTCPDIVFFFDDGSGGPIDPAVFSYQPNHSC